MELITRLEHLVTEKICCDASLENQAVFDAGVLVVITASVVEDLSSLTVPRLKNGNSPVEQLLLDIKSSFGKQMFLKEVPDIDTFLRRGKEALIAIPEITGYGVLLVPLSDIRTLFICGPNEAPEEFGIFR